MPSICAVMLASRAAGLLIDDGDGNGDGEDKIEDEGEDKDEDDEGDIFDISLVLLRLLRTNAHNSPDARK